MKTSAAAVVLTLMWGAIIAADDWPAAAVQQVFSENGRYFVRIVPGSSLGDTFGFASAPKGPYARGEFYAKQPNRSYKLVSDVALQNPISPTDALVTNSGHLVTFDNWHNLGYGQVVAIYGPNGRLIRAWTVEQLYTPEQITRLPMSTSSRWWRCSPHGYVDPDAQTTIYAFEHFGGTFTFKTHDGTFAYQAGQAECQPPRGPFSTSWFGR